MPNLSTKPSCVLRLFLPFLVLFCSVSPCIAQEEETPSPYTSGWLRDGLIVGGSFAVGLTASALNDEIAPLTEQQVLALSKDDINALDRATASNYSPDISRVSDILLGATMVLPVTFAFDSRMNDDAGTLGLMYFETLMFATFLPSYGKGGVQRTRPFVYVPEAPMEEKLTAEARRSFFSGHACLAFSSAVFFSTVYGDYYPNSAWKPYIWVGSLTAATLVGAGRHFSGAHFPTDILVGAAVGSLVGWGIPYLHRVNSDDDGMSLIPTVSGSHVGLAMHMKW
ncbi:MAG: phosphatase PAP2 family protein [Armatimonadetes bacterium]|nr:phosphatase PAP2 family protein [Armatimonadota bacterium]